ncbi:PAS domain-containing protein [Leucobacter luti]|uniref:PAS domain-containing protein n=1 Tax=Leucobacter luti TaxID=340320 RepID=UPI003D06C31C
MHAVPAPTGLEHSISAEELFFSTTDLRGVITSANSVFVRISGYSAGELVGSPHSIVRHPDMPGGIFAAMWDTLERNEPFCGYISNLAADGGRYDVFATVTPLREGYLSVRIAPRVERFRELGARIARSLTQIEQEARATGANRREVARTAASRIDEVTLASCGLSQREFQRHALPEEIQQHIANNSPLPVRQAGGRLGATLSRTAELAAALDEWRNEQDAKQRIAGGLLDVAGSLRAETETLRDIGEEILADPEAGGSLGGLVQPLRFWALMQGIVELHLIDLSELVDELIELGTDARFGVALAQLHALSLHRFTIALVDDAGAQGEPVGAIHDLVWALNEGVSVMVSSADDYRAQIGYAARRTASVRAITDLPIRLLRLWSDDFNSHRITPRAAQLARRLAASIEVIEEALKELASLTSHLASLVKTPDADRLRELLSRIDAATAPRYASAASTRRYALR